MKWMILFLTILGLPALGSAWPMEQVPQELTELAVEEAKAQFPNDQSKQRDFVAGYCEGVLDGFRYGKRTTRITFMMPDEAGNLGHKAGVKAYLDGAVAKLGVTPLSFWYLPVTLTGIYKPGFETSHFLVRETGELLSAKLGEIKQGDLPANKEITVNGLVSLDGTRRYGHMGMYKRELIILGEVKEYQKPASLPTPTAGK